MLAPRITLDKSERRIGKVLRVWGALFGQAIFMVGPKQWKRQHRIILRALGTRHTASFFETAERDADEIVEGLRVRHAAAREQQYNTGLREEFTEYTIGVIMKIILGAKFEGLRELVRDTEWVMECQSDPWFLLPGRRLWGVLSAQGRAPVCSSSFFFFSAKARGAPLGSAQQQSPSVKQAH